MCDIVVATPRATRDHVMIFAKNSDRDPNEAQVLEYIPRLKHDEDRVRLTYVDFPQVKETYAILISRPWWIWGAEMGVNEFNLAIGNTAVFTRERIPTRGILGMDIIRLALERTRSAREALNFMVKVIEDYGQGGNASYEHKMLYSNSFMIADPNEAWVLETAGKYWVAKRIDTVYSISNALTIDDDWDLASDEVVRLSRRIRNFSFSRYFSDKVYTYFAHGRDRRRFTFNALKAREGDITLDYVMGILRGHAREPYYPWRGSMRDVCMHYGGYLRPTQTASSQISILKGSGISTHWFTGTSLPCLSVFKPLFMIDDTEEVLKQVMGELPTNRYNPRNYWWVSEYLRRKLVMGFGSDVVREYINDVRKLETEIINKWNETINNNSGRTDLAGLSAWAFNEELRIIKKWMDVKIPSRAPFLYIWILRGINKKANLII
ncbi:MAG: C69 family dipeptidase [Vulcanisaeta sp.]|uniref:C69 family dipeptidase n=1 Tax=Vulcanisaeta sp. TaxID=2020871 RepID=UPI003D11EAAE